MGDLNPGAPRRCVAPFETSVKLRFYDMDRAGMVFHGAYTRLFQDAFEELMEASGFVEKQLEPELGVRVPVVRHEMEFPAPPDGDELTIEVEVARLGTSSARFALTARDEGGTVTARAKIVRVCIDEAGRSTEIPEPLRAAWERFEATADEAAGAR